MKGSEVARPLAKPDYITFGPQQQIVEIFCKLCGNLVAGLQGEGYQRRFYYFPNYVEFKFSCDDRSSHVTNLCDDCLSEAVLDSDILQLLHDADVAVMDKQAPGSKKLYDKRKVGKITRIDAGKRGIE